MSGSAPSSRPRGAVSATATPLDLLEAVFVATIAGQPCKRMPFVQEHSDSQPAGPRGGGRAFKRKARHGSRIRPDTRHRHHSDTAHEMLRAEVGLGGDRAIWPEPVLSTASPSNGPSPTKPTVIVHSMDRLARNLDDLRRLVRTLTGKGVRVEFVRRTSPSPARTHRWPPCFCRSWGPSPSSNAP